MPFATDPIFRYWSLSMIYHRRIAQKTDLIFDSLHEDLNID